jgi:AGZA family xanthine/uracil permease-like MFS transporter
MKIPVETALGAVFWSGIIFFLLSVFNVRTLIVKSIPKQIRYSVSVGIGLFITLIGFADAKFIISKGTPVLGMAQLDMIALTFLVGLIITSILVAKNIRGALIIGIVITTILSIPIGRFYGDASAINFGTSTLVSWNGVFSAPDFSLVGKLDLIGSLKWAIFPVIFAMLFTDMFDSLSTFVGVAEAANLVDKDGEPRNIKQSLIVDAVATGFAGILGTSPGTAYIESAAGVQQGGRTGLTALVAGLLFIPFMFLSPLLSIVPMIATAPALILVGVFMLKPVLKINWSNMDDAIPAFLAMVLIPFTFSITQGIIWGFLSWTFIKLAMGKYKEISVALIVIDIFAILLLISMV